MRGALLRAAALSTPLRHLSAASVAAAASQRCLSPISNNSAPAASMHLFGGATAAGPTAAAAASSSASSSSRGRRLLAAAGAASAPTRCLLHSHHQHQQQQQRLAHHLAPSPARRNSSSSSSSRPSARAAAAFDADAAAAAAPSSSSPAEQRLALASIRSHLASRLPSHCCGCGVRLQQEDSDGPGFFQVPARLTELAEAVALATAGTGRGLAAAADNANNADADAAADGDSAGFSGAPAISDEERRRRAFDRAAEAWLDAQQRPTGAGAVTRGGGGGGGPSSSSSSMTAAAMAAAAAVDAVSSGPAPRRVTLEGGGGGSSSSFGDSSNTNNSATTSSTNGGAPLDLLCARCYSLTHYGRVRSALAEAAMPQFDLARKVGRKIALQRDRRATVMVVVDITDFDGSLPREALQAMLQGSPSSPGAEVAAAARRGGGGGAAPGGGNRRGYGDDDPDDQAPFTLVVAANKFDLLPPQATAARVERWVRERLLQAGLPRPERVFMTSAATGLGVRPMLEQLRAGMAFREDLWVVGAQNAGKSSLIAAMQRAGAGGGPTGTAAPGGAAAPQQQQQPAVPLTRPSRAPTIAPVPGTTLGVLRVPGVPLGQKQRVFDTPGVPHGHQLTSRLPLAEAAALLPARRLKPRTWRVAAGTTILAGGLVRLDVLEAPGPTLYVTLFASDTVGCHAGKTVAAEERRAAHAGGLLVPPYGAAALEAAAAAKKARKAAVVAARKKGKGASASSRGDNDDSDEDEEEDGETRGVAASGSLDSEDDDDDQRAAAANKAALIDLPELVALDVRVEGDSWREHTVDVAVAGLGWFALGCGGAARLRVWVPRGTAVTTHKALVPDYARDFERPGFSRGLPAAGVAAAGGISLSAPASSSSSKRGAGGRGGGRGRGRGGGGGGQKR